MMRMGAWAILVAALSVAVAAPSPTGAVDAGVDRGPVTNLPLPRFVSLKANEGNARRGPGTAHRIDWVFTRRDMPLRVTAEHEHWRRVEDRDGAGGWVHYALLSGVRTALVEQDLTPLHARADEGTPVMAYLESGVVARLMACTSDWCRVNAEGIRGWARKSALWGVLPDESFD